MSGYYDFLTNLYYLKTNQLFPELLLNDESDSEVLIPFIEDAISNGKIVTYEDLMDFLKINEKQYDIIING